MHQRGRTRKHTAGVTGQTVTAAQDRKGSPGISIRNEVSVTGRVDQGPGGRKSSPGISTRNQVSVTWQGDRRPSNRKGSPGRKESRDQEIEEQRNQVAKEILNQGRRNHGMKESRDPGTKAESVN